MKTKIPGIRKAAILVASLEAAAADRLLARFAPEQARQLRMAAAELGPVDPELQRQVLEEFFRIEPLLPAKHPAGVDLDDHTARRLQSASRWRNEEPRTPAESDARPFHFLQDAEIDKLARALKSERPQTVALVLSHLPPEQAGGVLGRLEPGVQVDVIRRLVDLEETDPEILREVEQALELRLSRQVPIERRRVAGVSAVNDILHASTRSVGGQILDNLAHGDRALAERLGPGPVDFEDLLEMQGAGWAEVMRVAESEVAVLALVGAPPALIERVLAGLPGGEAAIIRQRLDHPGPTRLRDVEQARQEIAALARRLATQGRITLPPMLRQLPVGTAA
jgi:flagellar motor switch protein FliG